MRGVERITAPDAFADSVFNKMQNIVGDVDLPLNKASGVIHVTPEDAIRELLEMQRVSVVPSPTASR